MKDQAASLYTSIVDSDSSQESEQEQIDSPQLTTPDEQSFSIGNVELGDSKDTVNETLGESEEVIRNGSFNYQITSDGEYDVYQLDGNYVTIFIFMRKMKLQLFKSLMRVWKHLELPSILRAAKT
ncbi:CAP-associated domain-containing protein [Oceanobacillus sojae]|uniref:CAP-associated domain-containing protein n=1 Tax=Oceanobacillus sojae TaxID=582851 RepID=UPI00288346F3|nr:CAP-associated domain-containing protein [Oceanobacillus sojae]